jgi:hypothetical protein
MGCKNGVCQSPDEKFRHDEEISIREWEKSLDFYKYNYFDVISKLNAMTYLDGTQNISLDKFKKLFKNFFEKDAFWKLFENDTFFKQEGKFSITKIEYLILLVTLDGSKSNNIFSDKIIYITKIYDEEDDVNKEEFKKMLRILVEISCQFLPRNYSNFSNASYNYEQFDGKIDKITDKYFESIFQNTSNLTSYLELKENTKNPSVKFFLIIDFFPGFYSRFGFRFNQD